MKTMRPRMRTEMRLRMFRVVPVNKMKSKVDSKHCNGVSNS